MNVYETQLGKCDQNVGVDLNRNYGVSSQSGKIDSSVDSDPCSDHYHGPNPFSEPETTAIRNFIERWTNI